MPEGNRVASILFAASEVTPFAKTGGLADVCGALPAAMARRGHDCAVIMPLYAGIHRQKRYRIEPTDHFLAVPLGNRVISVRLWRGRLPGSEVPIFFIENRDYFERDNPDHGAGLYQYRTYSGEPADYADNGERFTFFNRAIMEAVPYLGMELDILHLNDWQTGLVPVYLRELYRYRPYFKKVRTLFTIHNLAYQGVFPAKMLSLTGLDGRLFNAQQLEFYGQLNFLKSGIVFADWVNTVSPSYAQEIQTRIYGCNLEGVLSEKRYRLNGIVNGIDYQEWNPETNPNLPAPYNATTLDVGKARCKAALQGELGLEESPSTPLIGVVARLVEQKGIDLIIAAMPELMERPIQVAVLGTGRAVFQQQLYALHQRYPRQLATKFVFDLALAHRVEAGADLFLMPSAYEPSGLNQLYSLRYGTVPIVRATGGLIDTVTDASEENLHNHTATGFKFIPYNQRSLVETVDRAVTMYRQQPEKFRQLIRTGMQQDWSWERSAGQYEEVYFRLIEERNTQMGRGRFGP